MFSPLDVASLTDLVAVLHQSCEKKILSLVRDSGAPVEASARPVGPWRGQANTVRPLGGLRSLPRPLSPLARCQLRCNHSSTHRLDQSMSSYSTWIWVKNDAKMTRFQVEYDDM